MFSPEVEKLAQISRDYQTSKSAIDEAINKLLFTNTPRSTISEKFGISQKTLSKRSDRLGAPNGWYLVTERNLTKTNKSNLKEITQNILQGVHLPGNIVTSKDYPEFSSNQWTTTMSVLYHRNFIKKKVGVGIEILSVDKDKLREFMESLD